MRKLSKLFRRAVTTAALVVVLTAVGCAQGKKSADSQPGPGSAAKGPGVAEIAVQAVPVQIGALVVDHQTSGTVKPVMQSQVVGQVSGVVARVVRKAGDWVEKGDTVIQLDDSQLKLSVKIAQASLDAARINLSTGQDTTKQANPRLDLQVRSAESALSVAKRNYDARKALFALGGATSGDVDRAKSDMDMAQANLEAARTALDQNQKADVQDIAQLKLDCRPGGLRSAAGAAEPSARGNQGALRGTPRGRERHARRARQPERPCFRPCQPGAGNRLRRAARGCGEPSRGCPGHFRLEWKQSSSQGEPVS